MTRSSSSKSRYIFLLLRLAVVAAGVTWAIVWVSSEKRWASLADTFRRMNLAVFALTLAVFIACQGLVAFRWWLLLKTQDIFIRPGAAVRLHFLGLFYNNFMPSSVGGDLLRAWYVTKHTEKRFEAALSVFVDRFIGLASTLLIALFFYAVFMRGRAAAEVVADGPSEGGFLARHARLGLYILAALAAALAALLSNRPGRALAASACRRLWAAALNFLAKLKDAVVLYLSRPMAILAVFGITVFLQIATITAFWLLGRTMAIPAALKYYYVFFTLTWVLGALPVSIGGAVVVEGLLAYFFVTFAAVRPEAALALALCQRIVWMLASLPGAVIHVAGAHLPKNLWRDDAPVSPPS
ncbi:MAG: flippase-like domain-containing protein [Phycisphaerales bacterium]|nr:MAG: flippase-like domain-containing protein [Phycisphaerales bacterium]